MRTPLIVTLLVTMLGSFLLYAGAEMPLTLMQEEHPKPTEFCTPNHKNPERRCDCVNQDHGAGCKDGKRDIEMRSCGSYCWKEFCHCCLS